LQLAQFFDIIFVGHRCHYFCRKLKQLHILYNFFWLKYFYKFLFVVGAIFWYHYFCRKLKLHILYNFFWLKYFYKLLFLVGAIFLYHYFCRMFYTILKFVKYFLWLNNTILKIAFYSSFFTVIITLFWRKLFTVVFLQLK